jgi:hypothetical protein
MKQQFCVFVQLWKTAIRSNCWELFREIIGLMKDDGTAWLRAECQNVYILQFTDITSQRYSLHCNRPRGEEEV